ncbi:ankyrin repeat domain-containing protein [Paenibacillus fonticola]|uniref:ankyrin repeat domain-containing protein n=1 Tax=Paenibacillus fonticola TaxID=379896 RepID=UPI00036158AE|nr:ankyrin repeat domain-containing protein [Paenibacillus fonticola]
MPRGPLSYELVREFIVAAHGDYDEVKRLLFKEPALIHAVIDWGSGDWESALGAASHTGNYNIAKLLLEHGARMDIFAAAMLGELNIVKAIVENHPQAVYAKGPHGISLIRHAEAGGNAAIFVYEYLSSLLSKEVIWK